MKTYIALLRGINVGGNHKVEMNTVNTLFKSFGYSNVKTYINSGNIIFQSEVNVNPTELETHLYNKFLFKIPTVVLTADELVSLTDKIPKTWLNNEEFKTDVMFLIKPVENIEKDLKINTAVDSVKIHENKIVWHINRADYAKSGISKLVGTEIYKSMTIRNINTVRKLATLV